MAASSITRENVAEKLFDCTVWLGASAHQAEKIAESTSKAHVKVLAIIGGKVDLKQYTKKVNKFNEETDQLKVCLNEVIDFLNKADVDPTLHELRLTANCARKLFHEIIGKFSDRLLPKAAKCFSAEVIQTSGLQAAFDQSKAMRVTEVDIPSQYEILTPAPVLPASASASSHWDAVGERPDFTGFNLSSPVDDLADFYPETGFDAELSTTTNPFDAPGEDSPWNAGFVSSQSFSSLPTFERAPSTDSTSSTSSTTAQRSSESINAAVESLRRVKNTFDEACAGVSTDKEKAPFVKEYSKKVETILGYLTARERTKCLNAFVSIVDSNKSTAWARSQVKSPAHFHDLIDALGNVQAR